MAKRGRTDYRLQRRALLADVHRGLRSVGDVCDAHPELVRTGMYQGESIDALCPICDDDDALRLVRYVFGVGTGPARRGGRPVSPQRLRELTKRYGQVATYSVEVCIACHWHHLRESFWLDDVPAMLAAARS